MPGLRSARGPDMHSLSLILPPGKNLRDVPGLPVLTHSALLYNFSCGTPLTPSQSVSSAPSPASFLFPFYPFFQPNFSPSVPLHQPPTHPSPDLYIHLLSSQHILPCYCFSFRLGRPVFTNGLLPSDQCFRLSCINYWKSRMELNEIPMARTSCFLTRCAFLAA